MSSLSIFFAIYAATTGIALVLTYREHRRSGACSLVLELASLLACTLWPVRAVSVQQKPLRGTQRSLVFAAKLRALPASGQAAAGPFHGASRKFSAERVTSSLPKASMKFAICHRNYRSRHAAAQSRVAMIAMQLVGDHRVAVDLGKTHCDPRPRHGIEGSPAQLKPVSALGASMKAPARLFPFFPDRAMLVPVF